MLVVRTLFWTRAVVRGDVADRAVSLGLGELLPTVADGSGSPPDAVDKLRPTSLTFTSRAQSSSTQPLSALDVLEELPGSCSGRH